MEFYGVLVLVGSALVMIGSLIDERLQSKGLHVRVLRSTIDARRPVELRAESPSIEPSLDEAA